MVKKKLLYVPGLISLIGLPLLLLIISPEDTPMQTVLKLHIPSDNTTDTLTFSKANVDRALKGKKIERILLNESLTDEPYVFDKYLTVSKWNFIKKEMERLQFTNDTSTILDIQFGDESTYRQYVGLINLAVIYGYKRYAYTGDDFYFFANKPLVICKCEPFSPEEFGSNLPKADFPTAWDFFRWRTEAKCQQLIFEIKQSPLLSLGFVVLILIPFLMKFFLRSNRLSFSLPYKPIQS